MRRIAYLYEQPDWYDFKWNRDKILPLLSKIRYEQGRIRGRTESLNPLMRKEALIHALTAECMSSASIEGEIFTEAEAKSAVARCLNIRIQGMIPCNSLMQGIASVVCDAYARPDRKISGDFFKAWHKKLFPGTPAGEWRNEALKIEYRQQEECLIYPCPEAAEVKTLMNSFTSWLQTTDTDPLIVSGIAHIWFLAIHPFHDGNGMISRAIAQFYTGKSEAGMAVYYSLSQQLLQNKASYFKELNAAQQGNSDITAWLEWYLEQVLEAVNNYRDLQKNVIYAQNLEHQISKKDVKPRQKKILQKLGERGENTFTSAHWAEMAGVSQDSAIRDIRQLLNSGLVQKLRAGGRSTQYRIVR